MSRFLGLVDKKALFLLNVELGGEHVVENKLTFASVDVPLPKLLAIVLAIPETWTAIHGKLFVATSLILDRDMNIAMETGFQISHHSQCPRIVCTNSTPDISAMIFQTQSPGFVEFAQAGNQNPSQFRAAKRLVAELLERGDNGSLEISLSKKPLGIRPYAASCAIHTESDARLIVSWDENHGGAERDVRPILNLLPETRALRISSIPVAAE